MIRVKIGSAERELINISDNWINQQLNRRRADGEDVCVLVNIKKNGLNMMLSTPTCQRNTSDSRRATTSENQIFDLWDRMGLSREQFEASDIIAFLKQVKN